MSPLMSTFGLLLLFSGSPGMDGVLCKSAHFAWDCADLMLARVLFMLLCSHIVVLLADLLYLKVSIACFYELLFKFAEIKLRVPAPGFSPKLGDKTHALQQCHQTLFSGYMVYLFHASHLELDEEALHGA